MNMLICKSSKNRYGLNKLKFKKMIEENFYSATFHVQIIAVVQCTK